MGVRAVARAECSRSYPTTKNHRDHCGRCDYCVNLNTAAAGLGRAAFAERSSPHRHGRITPEYVARWRQTNKGRLAVAINARAAYAERHGPGRLSLVCSSLTDDAEYRQVCCPSSCSSNPRRRHLYNCGRLKARILSLSIFKGVERLLSFCNTASRLLLAASCFVRVTFLSLTCSVGYRPGDDSSRLSSGNIR